MSFANLSAAVAGAEGFRPIPPPDPRVISNAAQNGTENPHDFQKLVQSLIGGEVAPIPPTQFQGQETSVGPTGEFTGKRRDAKVADTTDPAKEQKDPKDQNSGGLFAMMNVPIPATLSKPPLALNLGRSLGEDTYAASPAVSATPAAVEDPKAQKPENDAPQEAALPLPAVVTLPLLVPSPAPKDLPLPKLELNRESSKSPELPEALGKILPEARRSTEPISFTAGLTEREQPQAEKNTKLTPNQLSVATEPETARTNPKPAAPAPVVVPENDKTKPNLDEPTSEIAQTNPKSSLTFAVPVREAEPAQAKAVPGPEGKQAATVNHTDLQEKPAVRTEAAREISIRIPSSGNRTLDVHLIEHNGKVNVTVRTSDPQLSSALRGELTELVRTLDQRGYKTETWTPADTYPLGTADSRGVRPANHSESYPDGPEQQQPGDAPSGGNPQQKQNKQQNKPGWLIELEGRLKKEA